MKWVGGKEHCMISSELKNAEGLFCYFRWVHPALYLVINCFSHCLNCRGSRSALFPHVLIKVNFSSFLIILFVCAAFLQAIHNVFLGIWLFYISFLIYIARSVRNNYTKWCSNTWWKQCVFEHNSYIANDINYMPYTQHLVFIKALVPRCLY